MTPDRMAEIASLAGAEGMQCPSPPASPPTLITRAGEAGIGPSGETIPATMTAAHLAVLFDVDARTIHTLRQKGVLASINSCGTATFDTRAAIAAYLRFSRRANTADLESEKIRLASAQAEKIELQNAAARGELIPAAEVRAAWLSLATDLRAGILAAPSRIASRLGLDRTMQAAIDAELREALGTLDAKEHTQ